MHTSKRGLELIKHFEHLALKPYICPAGQLTVGFGHCVRTKKERTQFQQGISEPTALQLLAQDVAIAERAVMRLASVSLTQNQFDALVSLIFNIGSGAFQRSALRSKVNRSEHDEVPEEFMRWVWAGGRKLRGLMLRRAAEARLYQG